MGDGALAGVRVLDLSTARAALCGRTLAEFGADVVKVEPPGGDEGRRRAPLAAFGSLYWETVGVGVRSVIVDLDGVDEVDAQDGRAVVREMAMHADVLIESFDVGVMASHGLSYDELVVMNPGLVYVSVTPYGQTGPKSAWAASDLTLEAASGRLAMQRDGQRPPVPIGYPQASFHAGVQAAADVLIALRERESGSGCGQHLDLSMQAVMVHTTMSQATGARVNKATESAGTMDDPDPDRAEKLALLPGIWECADGFVAAPLTAGALPLVAQIIATEANVDDDLRAYDWNRLVADVLRGRVEDEFVARGNAVVARYFAGRTKAEMLELAFEGDFRLGPLQTTRDLLADEHLRERGYWGTASDAVTRPGPAVRMSRTPMRVDLPVARTAGGDSHEDVVKRWSAEGSGSGRGSRPRAGSRSGSGAGDGGRSALAGLKVADFSWVAVGPTMGRALADHGATVVRVESSRRMDVARTLAPWNGTAKGINDSLWYAHYNAGKLGLSLDLSSDEGRSVARRLIDWADVVIESFSPGTMAKLCLDYDTVSKTNPGVVMMSTSLLGQTGPMASFAGFGQQAVGLCGISTITGWPDRPPFPPMGAYTDVVAPKYGTAAIMAALHARDDDPDGRGQHLDMSQVEASIRFIEPLVLDESVNGRTAVRPGLSSSVACPHGVYALAGENRFVAIAVETNEQWRALKRIAGSALDAFAADLDLAARQAVGAELDVALARWVRDRDGFELESLLAPKGVPAARVAKPAHVAHDSHLEARGFFVTVDHTAMGPCDLEGPPTIFSAQTTPMTAAAPCLGEHTDLVLSELLGYSADEVNQLRTAGVLE